MPWTPRYTITNRLLLTIRQIGEAMGEVRKSGMTPTDLAKLEYQARELSSYASTSIEGNPLPLTDVKRILKKAPIHVRDTEREVLNYNRALQHIHRQVHGNTFTLSRSSVNAVHRLVVGGLMERPSDIGAYRKAPVVIRDPRVPDSIVFMPPNAEDVAGLCRTLYAFVHANLDTIDPIILAGLFHRQFVIIHPFMDGNGRTTRLLTTAVLGMTGLDVFQIFSFENYYNRNVTRYFREVGLRGDYYELADTVDFTSWLEYFAEGILDELTRVRKSLVSASPPPRLGPHHHLILDYLRTHGSISQKQYGGLTARSLAARKQDFKHLVESGLILPQGGGRSLYYVLAPDTAGGA